MQQLKHQLAQSEKKQQETKATVIALRTEFMQLVDMMSDVGANALGHKPNSLDLPFVPAEGPRPPQQYEVNELDATYSDTRNISQPPAMTSAGGRRRGGGSPTAANSPQITGAWAATGMRPGARPRGTNPRGGVHSAGASSRQRTLESGA